MSECSINCELRNLGKIETYSIYSFRLWRWRKGAERKRTSKKAPNAGALAPRTRTSRSWRFAGHHYHYFTMAESKQFTLRNSNSHRRLGLLENTGRTAERFGHFNNSSVIENALCYVGGTLRVFDYIDM